MKKDYNIMLYLACIASLIVLSGLVAAKIMHPENLATDGRKAEDVKENPPETKPAPDILPYPSSDTQPGAAPDMALSSVPNQDTTPGIVPNQNTTPGAVTDQDTTSGAVTDQDTASGAVPNQGTAPGTVPNQNTTPGAVPDPVTLLFAGDVNLDEDSKPVKRYDREQKGIAGGLSPDLIREMKAADILMINNEFAFSSRGAEAKNKSYTFRANPKRVEILKEMGVDIVSLANNHALDFGTDALIDTFATLEDAGIDYVGAGETLDRAKAPVYYNIGGVKIAFLAASRVVFAMDWYAKEDRPGMVGTYDPALILESIREADKYSDYVVVYVHWGVEMTNEPVDYQRELAMKYIDAGADAVVGCHPHVMQGLEFYKGKPIAYSLGNFWFNASNRESGLLRLFLDCDGTFKVQLIPVRVKDTYTYLITDEEEKKAYYDFMEGISFRIEIDNEGFLNNIP